MFFRSKIDEGEIHSTMGLWKSCASVFGQTVCGDYTCSSDNSSCGKILAARAFVTIACILSIISAVSLFVSLVASDRLRSMLLLVGKLLAWICLIAGIIGVAIGIDTLTRYESERVPWGASSIIGVIALVVNAVGAVVSLLAN